LKIHIISVPIMKMYFLTCFGDIVANIWGIKC